MDSSSHTPMVQRVSKTNFVVKCPPSERFPLGLVHCSFIESRNKSGIVEQKFVCPCRKVKHLAQHYNNNASGTQAEHSTTGKECVHFYACVLAFISDDKLLTEFTHHVQVPYKFER